jgi:hypothetical protein
MTTKKMRAAAATCLAGLAGLVAAGTLVLAAPAGALQSGGANADDSSVASGNATAINDSTASGDAVAINGSVASGCSTAINDSTASGGGACGPAAALAPAPAHAVPAAATVAAPTFAG